MNDDKFRELKKNFWWIIPLTLIAILLLITGYDPIGNWLGPQAERTIQITLTFVIIGYLFYQSIRQKR
jgi:hypothetical protein